MTHIEGYILEITSPTKKKRAIDAVKKSDQVYKALKVDKANKVETDLTKDELKTLPAVVPKDMNDFRTVKYNKEYLDKGLFEQDIANALVSLQRTGVVVTDVKITTNESILGATTTLKVSVLPVDGEPSTLTIELPKLDEQGNFTRDGIVYRMRLQKTELPIRKVAPDKVVCNTYYGVLFITRSSKVVDDLGLAYYKAIRSASLDLDTDVRHKPVSVFDHTLDVPSLYGQLSQYLSEFSIDEYNFNLDYHNRDKIPGFSKSLESNGRVVVGHVNNTALIMDMDNVLYLNKKPTKQLNELLGLNPKKLPKPYANIKVLGATIPMGIVLASLLGLTELLKQVATASVIEPSDLTNVEVLAFKDTKLYISDITRTGKLIVNGLLKLKDFTKDFTLAEFDTPDIYQLWFTDSKLGIRYYREIKMLEELYIDDIVSRDLLAQMGEPTEFKALMLRATELLTSEQHERPADGHRMRVRGNERMAGFMYRELIASIRAYKSQLNLNKRKLELSNWQVLSAIQTDHSVKPIEDPNPIQAIKEQETVVLSGQGGVTSQTVTTAQRKFDPNDIGFISEASTDSGDVGIVTFLSAASNLNDLRGTNGSSLEDAKEAPAQVYSTSYMLAPGLDKDHYPRVAFTNIQNTHNINMLGSETPYVRTGYEYVLAYKVSKKFAWMAEQDGEVTGLTDSGMKVTYKDGSVDTAKLGIVPGKAADKQYPHRVVPVLSLGDKFKAEQALAYNPAYFAIDELYPDKLCYKSASYLTTAFVDDLHTYEDSCTISSKASEKLNTETLKVKVLSIDFNKIIENPLKTGDKVNVSDPLVIILDEVSQGVLDKDAASSLVNLVSNAPKAKTKGTIVNVEAIYNGELDSMTESLRAWVSLLDKDRAKKAKTIY